MTMQTMRSRLMNTPKRERLEARVSPELKERLQLAADIQGRSLTDFLVVSAQQAADTIIREQHVLTLSEQDSRAFVEALLNPPAPNDTLRAAAERYRQTLLET